MIKKLPLIIILAFAGLINYANAQCVPDISITTPGIYPDSATGLPGGFVGVPYSETIQARVPVDTNLSGLPVIITSITVTSLTGLPPGLPYSCTPSSCVFPGGSNGCMLISGTPTTSGVFPLTVELTANGTIFGTPVPPQVSVVDYYFITIDTVSGVGLSAELSDVKFDLLQNSPNPANSYTDVSFSTPLAGDFTLKVYNMIGKEVLIQHIRGMAGINTTRLNLEGISSGVYMLSIKNGANILTRRMVVSRK